jgi:hypothetical protein
MRTMIDFIINCAHNDPNGLQLKQDFIDEINSTQSVDQLRKWFIQKEYEVSDDECIRIYENKDRIYKDVKNKSY